MQTQWYSQASVYRIVCDFGDGNDYFSNRTFISEIVTSEGGDNDV